MRTLPWHGVPARALLKALPRLRWHASKDGGSPAADAAALMVYVALTFTVEPGTHIAAASYDELEVATGLSRSLVAQGVARLRELGLIQPQGSHQQRQYLMVSVVDGEDEDDDGKWYFKLPCRAIVSADGQRIEPLRAFTMRSRHELNALKLYLYFAAVRDRHSAFTMSAYETIHDRTGVPERDIKRALSLLVGCGLLQGIDRQVSEESHVNEPNKYYLRGHADLFVTSRRAASIEYVDLS